MHPHHGQRVVSVGAPLADSRGVVVMLHGRNAGPDNILDLVPRLNRPKLTYLAPAAANRSWYPYTFMAEREKNEPFLSSALARLDDLIVDLSHRRIDATQIVVLGFSQGACLATEFVFRHPRRYGGLIAFTGGLIGPPGATWDTGGSFDGMPAFFGCSDVDAHVPIGRVRESTEIFARMAADVTSRVYAGMGHIVNDDEIRWARELIDRAFNEQGTTNN